MDSLDKTVVDNMSFNAVNEIKSQVTKKGGVITNFNFIGPALVEASAGTGKTYTITGLIIRLLLGDYGEGVPFMPLSMEKMAIMTFTNAATFDLRRKIRERIHSTKVALVSGVTGDELVEHIRKVYRTPQKLQAAILLLANAERDIDRASISTIHSFCGSLLKRYATGTSVSFNAQFMQNEDDLRQEALVYALRELIYNKDLALAFSKDRALDQELEANISDNKDVISLDVSIHEYLRRNKITNLTEMLKVFNNYKASNAHSFVRLTLNGWPLAYENLEAMGEDFYCSAGELWPRGALPQSDNLGEDSKQKVPMNKVYLNLVKDCVCRRALAIFEKLKNNLGVITADDYLFRLDYALKTKNEAGEIIASEVRKRYPVMFIDEFQDTDQIQFDIVKRIYLDHFASGSNWQAEVQKTGIPSGFYIIGDPKQAIYRFRGADIYCYIRAREEVKRIGGANSIYKLDTNYRSDSDLVTAVNYLFAKDDVGIDLSLGTDLDILFEAVNSPKKRAQCDFKIKDDKYSAFNFFNFVGADLSPEKRKECLANSATKVISELLRVGTIKGERIQYKDLAILVSKEEESKFMQKALNRAGMPSTYGSEKGHIQCTDEFKAVVSLMKSVLDPRRQEIIHLLTGIFFSFTGGELDNFLAGNRFDSLARFLAECAVTLRQQGIMAMMVKFLFTREVWGNWSVNDVLNAKPDGSQVFTNIMHSAEIAAALSQRAGIPENLVAEMEELVNNGNGTSNLNDLGIDTTIRLPSVENIIRIYTCHSSKGLEYPIVLMPFAGIEGGKGNNRVKYCYEYNNKNKNNERCVDITVAGVHNNSVVDTCNRDDFEERARLWYVAATRAKHAMFVWVDDSINDESKEKKNKTNAQNEIPTPFRVMYARFKEAYAQNLADKKIFTLMQIRQEQCLPVNPNWQTHIHESLPSLKVQVPTLNMIDAKWRIASYSALTAHRGTISRLDQENEALQHKEDDIPNTDSAILPLTNIESSYTKNVLTDEYKECNRFTFPRGAAAGTFLHDVLEHMSFKKAVQDHDNLHEALSYSLRNTDYGAVSALWRPQAIKQDDNTYIDGLGFKPLCAWFLDILKTPLGGFSLGDLDDEDCFKEMEFLLSMPNTIQAGTKLESDLLSLNSIVNEFYAKTDPKMQALVAQNEVQFLDVTGLMTGFIDLLVRHDNKFYVIDYKSNYLGDDISNYHQEAMQRAVAEHRYDIQYMLYTVALKRFLQKIYGKDYSYDLIGGVRYLFLRGLSGEQTLLNQQGLDFIGYGVYSLRLPEGLIDALDDYLGGSL